jgi:hypothetical protein
MRKFIRGCRAAVRYAWASPATLVGLTLSMVAVATGARPSVVDGIVEVSGGRLHRLTDGLPAACRFGAITFGHVVICVDAATALSSRAHEQVHVRQYERWGILFFPLYAASSLVQLLRGRDPYRDNRFEREAFGQPGEWR